MTDRHAHLTDLMQARRLELGMKTWRALSAEAGISYETLRAIRAGENFAPGTADAIEKALQWGPGSIDRILNGGEPATAADEQRPHDHATVIPGTEVTRQEALDVLASLEEQVAALRARLEGSESTADEGPEQDKSHKNAQ